MLYVKQLHTSSTKQFSRWLIQGKKEDSNDLREVVLKHFLNGDSKGEIVGKVLISRGSLHDVITKYKSTNCIDRDRTTEIYRDRVIERQSKTNHHHL